MRGFGVHLSKAEIEELFKLFDVDNSGSITYDEFLKVLLPSSPPLSPTLIDICIVMITKSNKGNSRDDGT